LLAGTARTRAAWGALVLLALALVATGSRAALLAAVLGVLFVAALDRARRKRLLSGLAVAALLLGVACLPMIRGALPSGSLPQRLVEAATTDQAGTRALLYRRGALAIAEAPGRLAFGHGPDAAGVAFQPHVGPELQRR